jgi:DNA-directed RNA polymerase subunit RPC12/RpoP
MSPNHPNPLQARKSVKIQDTSEVVCEKCSHDCFQLGMLMRSVSPILTGAPKITYVPVEVSYCVKCGHVNNEFKPDELKKSQIIA